MRKPAWVAGIAALGVSLMLSTGMMPALGATGTDQADYSPGSVVTISGDNSDGAGYVPSETVHVDVQGPNGYTSACDGAAGAQGAWSCQVTLRSDFSAVGSYSYTTTGLSSGVTQQG